MTCNVSATISFQCPIDASNITLNEYNLASMFDATRSTLKVNYGGIGVNGYTGTAAFVRQTNPVFYTGFRVAANPDSISSWPYVDVLSTGIVASNMTACNLIVDTMTARNIKSDDWTGLATSMQTTNLTVTDMTNLSSQVVIAGGDADTVYPINLQIEKSTHASSERACIKLGDNFQVLTDIYGNGGNNFGIWSGSKNAEVIDGLTGYVGISTWPLAELHVGGAHRVKNWQFQEDLWNRFVLDYHNGSTCNCGLVIKHNGSAYSQTYSARLTFENPNGQAWSLEGPYISLSSPDTNCFKIKYSVYDCLTLRTSGDIRIQGSTAQKGSGTTWEAWCDMRLKTDVEYADLDICYNAIKAIPLRRYAYKNNEFSPIDKHRLGWIAQEVEEVFPKAVKIHNAYGLEDCRSLDGDQILMALYGAVQKIQERLEALEAHQHNRP